MRTIKILVIHYLFPHITSITTLFFKNLLPVLKTNVNVHMVWVVYTPEKLDLPEENDHTTTILDIHDYDNALEILQKIKPDIINADARPNFMTYAFSSAAKFLNIPIFGIFDNYFVGLVGKKVLYKSYLRSFFQSTIPSDTETNKKQFMKRGRFFIYKYLFLYRTQKAINVKFMSRIREFFMFLKIFSSYTEYPLYPKFACNIHFLDNENLIQPLIDAGFKRSTFLVTGNPMYDPLFKKMKQYKPTLRKNKKIQVLLITTSLYEHGVWTRKQRDEIVKAIVTEILKNEHKISLSIKIHPSSEKLAEYVSLVESIGQSIPIYQKGDILEFLDNADVVLAFSYESALTHALLAKKPIIICNFYNIKDLFLQRGLALECKKTSLLMPLIHKVLSFNPATPSKVNEYVRDFHFSADGQAAERVSNGILNLLKQNPTASGKI